MTNDDARDPATGSSNPFHAILRKRDTVGALSRHVDVVVLEISRSGCLFESTTDIAPGTLAVVHANVGGAWYADAVRVVRSHPVAGGGERYRLGAEFAWLWPADHSSLRRLAGWISARGSVPSHTGER